MENKENPWKTLSNINVYENPWIKVEHHEVINPNGNPGIYGKVCFKNIAVSIVALDHENHVYLVGQHRYTIDAYSWELPEGGCLISDQEDPLEAAKRELLEETGLQANQWTLMGEIFLSNSVTDEKAYMYLATELSQNESNPEDTEKLEIKKLPIREAIEMANNGEIKDCLSVVSLLKVPRFHQF
jgi:8-oxo-dGTP pyrophosphatase MutT (NUDIX family)